MIQVIECVHASLKSDKQKMRPHMKLVKFSQM